MSDTRGCSSGELWYNPQNLHEERTTQKMRREGVFHQLALDTPRVLTWDWMHTTVYKVEVHLAIFLRRLT